MGRNSKKKPPTGAEKVKKTRDELLALLQESTDFLRQSAAAFDGGMDHEAKRMAVTLRVLLHDTNVSHSLLGLLKLKARLSWHDTAEGIHPNNLMPTIPGLVILRVESGVGGSYVAPLGDRPPDLLGVRKPFAGWWNDPVSRFPGATWCRKDYVQTLANKEGGAHVDPSLTPLYDEIVNRNALGWVYSQGDISTPFAGNAATAGVRQITYEVRATLDDQVAGLV